MSTMRFARSFAPQRLRTAQLADRDKRMSPR